MRFLRARRADAPARRNRAEGTTCFYCGITFEGAEKQARTIDHRLPKGRGGTDGLVNIVFACRACNERKADRLEAAFVVSDWLVRRRAEVAAASGYTPASMSGIVRSVLEGYAPHTDEERLDVARVLDGLAAGDDLFDRSTPLHVTGSALPVHPPTGRVALHWHAKLDRWLQLGGHADAGEDDPAVIAMREAEEESGLALRWFPDAGRPLLLHVEVVEVPPVAGEPGHEHADFRYLVATDDPDAVIPGEGVVDLRWLTVEEALDLGLDDGLQRFVERAAALLR